MFANFPAVTASFAIVKAVDPVTSPVCVALVTLAVFAVISVLIEFANLSAVTASLIILSVVIASSAIVKAAEPVTSPVCVALGKELVTVTSPVA